MSLSKYVSSLALGLSLSACAYQAPPSPKVKPVIESIYPGRVVAIRVCDGMYNCTEWKNPEGMPYLPLSSSETVDQPAKPSDVLLPPPRLLSTGKINIQQPASKPKVQLPLEDNVCEEGECEGGVCRVPGSN